MAASTRLGGSNAPDYIAAASICRIEGTPLGPYSHCQVVHKQVGAKPGFAQVIIPLDDLYTVVPAVAGVLSSPTESIFVRDNAQVTAQLQPIKNGNNNPNDPEITVFSGMVYSIEPIMEIDHAIIILQDMRYWIERCMIVGSFWANVYATTFETPSVNYVQAKKAHLNPNNQPNCIWADIDGEIVPTFCTPFFGLIDTKTTAATGDDYANTTTVTSTIPNPMAMDQFHATYWTPQTFWIYLRFFTSSAGAAIAGARFPEFSVFPEANVTWPPGLEVTLGANFPNNPRKAFERVYHCHKLTAVLEDLCNAAGPFTLNVHHEDDGTNTLKIERTRFTLVNLGGSSPTGLKLTRANPASGLHGVKNAHLTINCENFVDVIAPVGGTAFIELRAMFDSALFSNDESQYGLDETSVPMDPPYTLQTVFNAEDALEFWYNKGEDPKIFMPAVFKQFDVCSTCQIRPGFDFQDGTEQEAYPMAFIGRQILPYLLSSLAPAGSTDEFRRASERYKIAIEVMRPDIHGSFKNQTWETPEDDIQPVITGDGVISFKNYRDQELASGAKECERGTFHTILKRVDTENKYHITLIPNRIRLTIAVACDHRITTPVAFQGNSGIIQADLEVDDSDRINFANGIATLAIDTGELLASEERSPAFPPYPIPQSLFTSLPLSGGHFPSAVDGSADCLALYGDAIALRSDVAFGYNQASRKAGEFMRLDRNGEDTSDRIDLLAEPGDMVTSIINNDGSEFPVKSVRKSVSHNFSEKPQSTKSQLV